MDSTANTVDRMAPNIELECKKICILQCAYAIAYSIVFQYFLLAIYLLFVNFAIFHPIAWILNTISIVCSFYTWLCLMPLLIFILIYGLLLAHHHFGADIYYSNRIVCLWKTALPKLVFVLNHIIVGFLTAWLYSMFLSDEYGRLRHPCYEDYCINERNLCLLLNGIYASVYYFMQERWQKSPALQFPLIKQSLYLKIRSQLYTIVCGSFTQCFLPTICYFIGYYMSGSFIRYYVSGVFGTQIENNVSIFDIRLIFSCWLISSQILSNMHLMDFLFIVFLTDYKEFPIDQPGVTDQHYELTLTEALSCIKVPVIQQLATLDLYTLANSTNKLRRTQLFALSIPGGHPYKWKALKTQCLNIINSYREMILKSTVGILQSNQPAANHMTGNIQFKSPASEMADKVRYRQFNESYGIRNMSMQHNVQEKDQLSSPQPKALFCQTIDEFSQIISAKLLTIKNGIQQIPGIYYFFGESSTANVSFLLKKHQSIAWTCQGLAALAAHSLKEDRYGVVQDDLQAIIMSLLKLKSILDKVCTIHFGNKIEQNNCMTLRNTVRRSIYNVISVFADYIQDIITDPTDLRAIQNFLQFKEA